jgi:Domain of Unknown Function (DUF349)
MKLISRLFTRAAQSPPVPEQKAALLHAEASNGAAGMADGETLRRLAGGSSPSAGAAQARLAQLIDERAVNFADLCADMNRPALFAIAALCKNSHVLPEALALVDDPREIEQIVIGGSASRLRQLAAERIDDADQLRRLLKEVRGRDKTVYRILKQKCDTLNEGERKAAQVTQEISSVCAALERHSHRIFDPIYVSTLEHLLTRRRSLMPLDAASDKRCEAAAERCREIIAAHERQIELLTARQAAAQLREHELATARAAAAAQAESDAQARRESAAAEGAEAAARAAKRADEERVFRQLGGLIRKSNEALREGNTQAAAGMRRALTDKWPTNFAVPVHLTRQLQKLDDQLSELKQWKDYAVAPKRLELIERMESLIDCNVEPNQLSKHIQSLQQEWRTIGRGIVSDAPLEWERFHKASQVAYQPCLEYFAAQAERRQANLENRKSVLARLAEVEVAESAEAIDGRRLIRVLREAPQEWRRYLPVDRETNAPVQTEFEASLRRLQARLDVWYERNDADKQSLVRRARHLLAQDDTRESIEGVKRLQMLWKETDPTPRERDQALWNEFREVCDAIFQRRDRSHRDYAAGLEAAKLQAVALCAEVEQVADASGPSLLAGVARIPEWRAAFDALGDMPRTEARGLHDRLERAFRRCEQLLTEQQRHEAARSIESLFEAARHLRACEWAAMHGAADRQSLRHAAESFIAQVARWPRGALPVIKEVLGKTDSMNMADAERGRDALRLLCIRAEILGEMPSPGEDESLRREYQVQRLMHGMGQGGHRGVGDWDALLLDWLRAGAVAPEIHQTLQMRFMRCLPANAPGR